MLERNIQNNAGAVTAMVTPIAATCHVQVMQEKYVVEDGTILYTHHKWNSTLVAALTNLTPVGKKMQDLSHMLDATKTGKHKICHTLVLLEIFHQSGISLRFVLALSCMREEAF